MPATALPVTSILYADEGFAGHDDPGWGLGRRLTWEEAASKIYPYLGQEGWSESDNDAGGPYDLGQGPGQGAWVEFTGSAIVIPQDVGSSYRIDLAMQIQVDNDSLTQAGTIDISYGIDGAPPTENGANRTVAANFAGMISAAFESNDHGGLTAGQTLTVWARIASGDGTLFGVVSNPTLLAPNVFSVTYPGFAIVDEGASYTWTGQHGWSENLVLFDATPAITGVLGYDQSTGAVILAKTEPDGLYDPEDGGISLAAGATALHGTRVRIYDWDDPGRGPSQVYANEDGALYRVAPPDPGWEQVGTDANSYDLGVGTGPGTFIEVVDCTILATEAVAIGDRIDAAFNIYCVNKTNNRSGTVEIGIGVKGNPPANGDIFQIPAGYAGYCSGSIVTTSHGGIAQNDPVSVWVRRFSGDNAQFGVDCVGTPDQHEQIVTVPGAGGGGGVTEDQDPVNWTGNHSWTQAMIAGDGVNTYAKTFNSGFEKYINGNRVSANTDGFYLASNRSLHWSTVTTDIVPISIQLSAEGTGILAQRNGTAAQEFRLYATTDAGVANYERLSLGYNGTDAFTIDAENGGTGQPKTIKTVTEWVFDDTNSKVVSCDSLRTRGGSGLLIALNGSYITGVRLQSFANGQTRISNYASSGGVYIDVNTPNVFYVRNLANNADGEITCGGMKLTSLPTSDPVVAGQLWNDAGTVKISAG